MYFLENLLYFWELLRQTKYIVMMSKEGSIETDHLSSVCLSVGRSVCSSVRPSVNFSHFHLLLQNHWANFNQTWLKDR